VLHTLEQLRRGIVDFCYVLDQAFIGFMWTWVYLPEFSRLDIRSDNPVMDLDAALKIVQNATIESSLLSLRVLDEFFADTGIRAGDIRSHHYQGYCSPGRFLRPEEYALIGRRVAHLTVDHSSREPWQMTELIAKCCAPSENFLAFIVEGAGRNYLPGASFDVASRLHVCRRMDEFMQNVLRRNRQLPASPTTTTGHQPSQ
jgi:hypothetical protein